MTLEALRAAPLFTGLSDADLERLAATVERQKLAPGELLLREGDPGDAMFVVVSGELEVTKRAGATEQPLARVGPGAIQGEIAALQGTERQASVRAVTEVEVLRIPREGLLALLDSGPDAALALVRTVLERLRSLELFVRQREKLAGLGTLAAGLAHELNNPAAAIRRSVQLAGEAIAERDKLHPPHDLLGIEPNPDQVPTDPLARADAVDELLELVGGLRGGRRPGRRRLERGSAAQRLRRHGRRYGARQRRCGWRPRPRSMRCWARWPWPASGSARSWAR